MIETACANNECTVGETGICVLNNALDDCPHRIPDREADLSEESSALPEVSVLPSPSESRRFAPSGALGLDDVRVLMRNEYCHVVGLLGEPDSGKTAYLVSLYLLLSRNGLNGFTYADSKSLMALDELSRGARSWEGGMPEQMTAHTVRSDGRSVGFLHFKLVRGSDRARQNVLIPDLPGEWTTSLVDGNRTDRLDFLTSADSIWLMVDGRRLADDSQRLHAIHRTNLLIDRLVAFLSPAVPALRLVVTRLDLARPTAETLERIRDRGARYKLNIAVDQIASFSEDTNTTAGAGLAALVAGTLAVTMAEEHFWPDEVQCRDG